MTVSDSVEVAPRTPFPAAHAKSILTSMDELRGLPTDLARYLWLRRLQRCVGAAALKLAPLAAAAHSVEPCRSPRTCLGSLVLFSGFGEYLGCTLILPGARS